MGAVVCLIIAQPGNVSVHAKAMTIGYMRTLGFEPSNRPQQNVHARCLSVLDAFRKFDSRERKVTGPHGRGSNMCNAGRMSGSEL